MTMFNWLTKDRQEAYVLNLEKQLVRKDAEIIALQEKLMECIAIVDEQNRRINDFLNHLNSLNGEKDKSNVIHFKSRKEPRK